MGAGSSKSTLSSDLSLDPLPYLTADLPQHIVENKLPPGSGRLFKTFRIRSREGASFVCKVAILKYSAASVSLGGAMVRNLSRASSLSAAGSTSEGRVVTSTQHRDVESESRNSETASTARLSIFRVYSTNASVRGATFLLGILSTANFSTTLMVAGLERIKEDLLTSGHTDDQHSSSSHQ